jgi:predicted CoA-binding protein
MKATQTLVLGASPNPERYSFLATNLLIEKGFPVYAYGIKKGFIGDTIIHNEWPEKGTIDTITLYIGPAGQKEYYDAIIALAPRRILFNPGTENVELQALASKNGIETMEACTLVLLKTGQYNK